MATSDEVEADLRGVRILMEKLLNQDDIAQLTQILKKHDAISKSKYKKVSALLKKKNLYESCQKIISALKLLKRERMKDIMLDENCPGDSKTKQLLQYLVTTSDENLNAMLRNWDFLEQNKDDIESMLGVASKEEKTVENDGTKRVKNLLFTSMLKLKHGGEEERQAVRSIVDCIEEKSREAGNNQMRESKQLENENSSPGDTGTTSGGSKPEVQDSTVSGRSPESDFFITPMPQELGYLDGNQYILEFRAVIGDSTLLPANVPLCFSSEVFGWSNGCFPMEYNQKRGYYFYRLLCNKNCDISIKYKFSYQLFYPVFGTIQTTWEILPYQSYGFVNRKISLPCVMTSHVIITNVCLFTYAHSWTEQCCKAMEKFLPSLEHVGLLYGHKWDTTSEMDIFSWINCVKVGWQTSASENHKPVASNYEQVLIKWLNRLLETASSNSEDIGSLILTALALALAFEFEGLKIQRTDLLVLLFKMMRADKLSPDACEQLYTTANEKRESFKKIGLDIPQFTTAMEWLYKQLLQRKNLDWILSLPLYWLMAHGKMETKIPALKEGNDLLHSKACLPRIQDFDWIKVCREHMTTSSRPDVLNKAELILEMSRHHPWIVNTYQFMLNNKEVVSMILEKEKYVIINLFPVECVLFQYLEACERGRLSQDGKNWEACNKFISEQIKTKIKAASQFELNSEEKVEQMDVCITLLDLCHNHLTSQMTRQRMLKSEDVLWCINTVVQNTVKWANVLELNEKSMQNLVTVFNKFLQLVKKAMANQQVNKRGIEYWCTFLSVEWDIEKVSQVWKNEILQVIQTSINNYRSSSQSLRTCSENYLDFYVNQLEGITLQTDVKHCLNEKAYKCAEELLKTCKKEGFFQSVTGWFGRAIGLSTNQPKIRFIAIFEKLFHKEYKNYEHKFKSNVTACLCFLCKWSFSIDFYQLFDKERRKHFGSEVKNITEAVSENFGIIVQSLEKDDIIVEHLEIILENKEEFLALCDILAPSGKKAESSSVDAPQHPMRDSIDTCGEYLETFNKTRKLVDDFIQVCNRMNLGAEQSPHKPLKDKVKVDTQQKKILDLVEPSTKHRGKPSCCKFFGISADHLDQFRRISSLKDSKVFRKMFGNSAVDTEIKPLSSWTDILDHWKRIQEQVLTLVKQIGEGSVALGVISKYFGDFRGDAEKIQQEVEKLHSFYENYNSEGSPDETEQQILENLHVSIIQITNMFQIQQADSVVDVFLELKKMLKLGGDFSDVMAGKEIMQNQQQATLADVPCELKLDKLGSFDANESHILKSFMEGKTVIDWLQKKMDDMKDVKVMCELAMISAGGNAIEMDRVSNLHNAVKAFAPLIFWTEEGMNEAGSEELIKQCIQVFENEKGTKDLLKKWDHTKRQLKWFEEVEKFYGSVEKSSLTRAQEINDRGIYTITKPNGNGASSVENCVQLKIQPKDNTDDALLLSIEELRELQSKLMLIAGEAKGQEDVNLFVEVLTSVQKLAEAYVDLVTSGCMLFAEWKAVIKCHHNDSVEEEISEYLSINIRFTDNASSIIGDGTHLDVNQLTQILRKSHEKWMEHTSSKRMEFYHLNQYNVQQIVYLCHELAKLDTASTVCDQVRILLSFVRENFTIEDLKIYLKEARVMAQQYSDTDSSTTDSCTDSDERTEQSIEMEDFETGSADTDDTKQNVAKEMLKAVRTLIAEDGTPEKVAKAAVQASESYDLTSCRSWILMNTLDDGKVEKVEQYSMDFNNTFDFDEEEDHEIEVIHSAFETNKSRSTLEEVICRLHANLDQIDNGTFLGMIRTVCEGFMDETLKLDLQDHLSMHLLGQFLTNLSQKNAIVRELLPGLHQGRPNLFMCNEEEILPTVLSLYMHSDDQPLPNRSEVLVCCERTTKDEVERFLRRAMCDSGDGGQLLYSLAFADKLNYAMSSAVEDIFNLLTKSGKTSENYQLVILLSKQQHYLGACFEKYLVDGKWSQSTENIHSYLKKHLRVSDLESSAASVTNGKYMVEVVTSRRSGVGKSLHIRRLCEKLEHMDTESRVVTIRLLENVLDIDYVIQELQPKPHEEILDECAVLIHVDMTPAVQHGIEAFAFNLFVLGTIQGSDGKVWKSHPHHLYAVEMTDFGMSGEKRFSSRHILNLLPSINCCAPRDVADLSQLTGEWLGMDRDEFRSETFQRPFQYLSKYEEGVDLDTFSYTKRKGKPAQCIATLLRHCCIENPSWAQLRHFCSFLNVQLKNCEKSVFCNNPHIKQYLLGLKLFAVKFMIRMAQDFATPSLEVSDKSIKDTSTDAEDEQRGFQMHQLRRKWEETSHPYVFFNEDGQTMTFINVRIDQNGFLLDQNGLPAEKIATPELVAALERQGISFNEKFDDYPREKKLQYLCQVMGMKEVFDPDMTYELTTDNVLKILAIHMRFRCQIPVIIMGETGCGKTRLVEFMSRLKAGANPGENVQNMITLKIHGGITVQHIHKSVEEAKAVASRNPANGVFTVLFYDEANTTEAIYAIKEVMCDKSTDGSSFSDSKLQIIAACNPYKKLSDAAIKKLEDSGLGYRIRTSETTHLFGNIPVRSLVYRVVALPPSLQPFIWDFGQLNDDAEKIYIQQMTMKLGRKLELSQRSIALMNEVLSSCQKYMRSRTDECRYVSLRDVERCMITYQWFHNHQEDIFPDIDREVKRHFQKSDPPKIEPGVRTLIQTVGVCYYASLDEREPFLTQLAECLNSNMPDIDETYIEIELASCQAAFVRNIQIGKNIARNEALQENVFMMAICADMKIPLFLIGKPGSSKSLAKTVVTNNMQGQASHAPLYQSLKEIQVLSYQCSSLTDAEGIEGVFTQCVRLQKEANPETYSAVVVLDEIGLAEDSPNMPLKVLHPLLEGRSADLRSGAPPDRERVGFVGISNWALDPAKMNRGIFLTRNKPTENDLKTTGTEITDRSLWTSNEDLFEALTSTYLDVYDKQAEEYFGLRDYYSLIKMICHRCTDSEEKVKFHDAVYAILRNFSGGDSSVVEAFLEKVKQALRIRNHKIPPHIPIQEMIGDNMQETESRFLLLLANQFSVVTLVESIIKDWTRDVQVVFGSSFPDDHSYTEVCRNINRIKVCMETGKTVILLNMAKIHESLYDALNQHFVTYGGQNYVDLGLGGHRVKCRIAKEFRLIVIEKKDVVDREYPIPLINRLEKHHFNSDGLLNEEQKLKSQELKKWSSDFANSQATFSCRHSFVGFDADTISSIVLTNEGDLEDHKKVLLQTCSVDAILRLRESNLREDEVMDLQKVYFDQQCHDNLVDVLKKEFSQENRISVLEVMSFSSILSKKDVDRLASQLEKTERNNILLVPLEQFRTQQEYREQLDKFFEKCNLEKEKGVPFVLLVQCAQAQMHGALIACARHCLMNKIREVKCTIDETNITVAFLMSMEREGLGESDMEKVALLPTHEAKIVYTDELRPSDGFIAPASMFIRKSLYEVFQVGVEEFLNEQQEDCWSLICIQSLLCDCVCESIARAKDSNAENERFLRRVEILLKLLESKEDASTHFRRIVLRKLVQLYSTEERQIDWIVEKANDSESLHEGGTFRKTLWLCLKEHMSRFLAYVVSIIDKHNNLDFVMKNPQVSWEINMWLGMLDLLEISWQKMQKTTEFAIRHKKDRQPCKLPFSFLLIDRLESQWNAMRTLNSQEVLDSFSGIFHHSKMKKIVADALETSKRNVMKSFTSDLIQYVYEPGTNETIESDLVEAALFDISMREFTKAREGSDFEVGDEIAVIFTTFKRILRKFKAFSEMLRVCPNVLAKANDWKKEQKDSEEFILHILAFKDVIGSLERMAENIKEPAVCIQWMDLARVAKALYDSVSGVAVGPDVLSDISDEWVSMSMLYFLLLQLLPLAGSDHDTFQKFVKVVAPHAMVFWRCSKSVDFKRDRMKSLRIVLTIVKQCCEDLHLKLLLNWQDYRCKICNAAKVKIPTFLPCGDFGCENCIKKHTVPGERCTTCSEIIPEDFVPIPASLNRNGRKMSEKMKSNCTSFFLVYLRKYCFKVSEGLPIRMETEIEQILKGLVGQSGHAAKDKKSLDLTILDLNINTKCSILQILLQYDLSFVTKEINRWLCELAGEMRNAFTTVLIATMERSFMANSSESTKNETKMSIFWQEQLGTAWRDLLKDQASTLNVKTLQSVAELRCAFTFFASLVNVALSRVKNDRVANKPAEHYMKFCTQLLKSDNMPLVMKEYVIKVACNKFGTDWLFRVAEDAYMRDQIRDESSVLWDSLLNPCSSHVTGRNTVLDKYTAMVKLPSDNDLSPCMNCVVVLSRDIIPTSLMKSAERCSADHWVLLGREYADAKSELYHTEPETWEQAVIDVLARSENNLLPSLLAITSWSDKIKKEMQDGVTVILEQNSGNYHHVIRFLTNEEYDTKVALKTYAASSQQAETLHQLITLVIAVTTVQNDILKGYYAILNNPKTTGDLFLPAMSEDVYFATPEEFRLEVQDENSMYTCPKGHLYSIGDCTRPYVLATCPECKSVIGGKSHKPADGNKRILKTARSQTGYKFHYDDNVSTGSERMSPQGAAVAQFMLHSCLFAAAFEHPKAISSVLDCTDAVQAQQHLVEMLQKNLQDLSEALARNVDDAVLILHKILLRISHQGPTVHEENWETLEARKEWELTFREDYLLPIFQNLENEIAAAREIVWEAEKAEKAPLYRLLQEVTDGYNTLNGDNDIPGVWEEEHLWRVIEHPNSAHLLQVLQDRMGIKDGEVTQIILEMPDLHLIKYLENILNLQLRLTEKYQRQIDMVDADRITLREYVNDGNRADEESIEEYILAWNEVFPRLRNTAPESLHPFFGRISLDSPLSIVLPSMRGRGQCAKILAEYLIDIQNQFLSRCKFAMKLNHEMKEVEVCQLRSTDFVCINKEKDLLNLIGMNTSYTIKLDGQGRHHLITYNIEALEKQVREKFVLCKKLINTKSLPCMRYPQDIGIGSDWMKVASTTNQEPLTAKLSQDIDRIVEIPEICEAVRTLANAISFLAMSNTDSSKPLHEFLEKDLKKPAIRVSKIPRSAQICHVLSLYQRLSWRKSVIFVQKGLEPYKEAFSGIKQEEIPREVLPTTKEAFKHTDVKMFQQRVNEMLITGTGVGNADWGLIEDVFPNLQFIDGDEDSSWYAKLPKILRIKHISSLFALSVNLKTEH